MKRIAVLAFFFALTGLCNAQGGMDTSAMTNLDAFSKLAETLLNDVSPGTELNLELLPAAVYAPLNSRMINYLRTKKSVVVSSRTENRLSISIERASVNYPETLKKRLFGAVKVRRIIGLKGTLYMEKAGKVTSSFIFSKCLEDTVALSSLDNLEEPSYEFTKGTRPPIPFFSGLLEPAIAIGASAVTAFLFFNVRSK